MYLITESLSDVAELFYHLQEQISKTINWLLVAQRLPLNVAAVQTLL